MEGTGGIGKTQLVLRGLRRIADQRPVVWITWRLSGPRGVRECGPIAETRTALALNPINAFVIGMLGCILGLGGYRDEALDRIPLQGLPCGVRPLRWSNLSIEDRG